MYLPLACVVVVAVVGIAEAAMWLRERWDVPARLAMTMTLVLSIGLACILTLTTMVRNKVYLSEYSVWMDVLKSRPGNLRAWLGVGVTLLKAGCPAEAARYFEFVVGQDRDRTSSYWIRHSTEFAMAYNNLGAVYSQCGRRQDAIEAFRKSAGISPSPEALRNLNLLQKNEEPRIRRGSSLDPSVP